MAVDVVSVTDAGLGNTAYLVDLGGGDGLLVDPQRDLRRYREEAVRRGLRIRTVLETHLHADFVSGGREWAAQDAELVVPEAGRYDFPHRGMAGSDELDLDGLTLRAIATPGHTPEHLAYLLLDGETPVALFSGGTLMAGGVARPDLISPDRTDALARAAYRSITQKLLTLPDDLPVYPTHGGGSFCSAGATVGSVTTIGQERGSNPLLQVADEDTFVATLLAGLGSYPPYFLHLREVNRAGPVVYGPDLPPLASLSADDVAAAVEDGATVVDARPIDRFAEGHLPGSISVELRGQFGTWLGWVVPFDTPVVVVLDDDQDERELVSQALTVGYEQLVGRLDGGVAGWRASGRETASIPLRSPGDPRDGRAVLDVRQQSEWGTGHVPDSRHRELGSLVDGPGGLPDGLLVHCGHGQRAMTAASLLRRHGLVDVAATTAGPAELSSELAR